MSSGVLSASHVPVHLRLRSAVIDFNDRLSLTSHWATSERPLFSSVLVAGYVPPFLYGPSACASLPQRGSASGPTSTGGGSGSSMFGQPAGRLAGPTEGAASFIEREPNGAPL